MFFNGKKGTQPTDGQLMALSKNWQKVEYTGEISRQTRSRVLSMLNAWAESIYVHRLDAKETNKKEGRLLRFLTVTLSKETKQGDNEIKRRLLMPFIEKLKKHYGLKYYFWRAEPQKNGRIHFHLIIDQFINKSVVNYEWDLLQFNAGITVTKPKKTNNYQSPSTRIESIKEGSSVNAYVSKYALKNEGGRKIEGRIWGCSDELKNISVPVKEYDNEFAADFQILVDTLSPKKYETEYLISYSIDLLRNEAARQLSINQALMNYYRDIYNELYVRSENNK